jgi:hypothetical protein
LLDLFPWLALRLDVGTGVRKYKSFPKFVLWDVETITIECQNCRFLMLLVMNLVGLREVRVIRDLTILGRDETAKTNLHLQINGSEDSSLYIMNLIQS